MSNSIQTDISAMNASRNIKTHQKNIQSNMEKLASGYKINTAADDAAGLAISEKLKGKRTQVTITKNAGDTYGSILNELAIQFLYFRLLKVV